MHAPAPGHGVRRLAPALLVGIAAFTLYTSTLAPTVTLVDSGELIVAAHGLGVAHPPGFPFYTLVAHAATWLPAGNVAVRVHLASAASAALACAVLTLLVIRITGAFAAAARLPRFGPALAGIVAGLLFACSRTFWSYATIAEVYALNTCLILLVILLVASWRQERLRAGAAAGTAGNRRLVAAAAVLGLAFGVHHVTVGLMLPALALIVYSAHAARPVARADWLRAAAALVAGLCVYLYLPLAAASSPVLNWGDPSSVERLWWHVSGRQYRAFLSFSADTMIEQFRVAFLRYVNRDFGPPAAPLGLGLAIVGLVRLWRSDRRLTTALGLIVAANLGYALNYDIDEDQDAYYLPTLVVLALAAGAGAAHVRASAAERARPFRVAAALLVLLAPAAALVANLPYTDRSRYFIARDYVANVHSTVPPGSLLLTQDWQLYSPMLYVRHVEHQRRDVTAIDVHLLRRSWYFDYLAREYPDLMQSAGADVTAFLEDLRGWEADPDRYDRNAALNRRINERFYRMIDAFIRWRLADGRVYITQDVLQQDRAMAARFSGFGIVPQGLVFQVVPHRDYVPPADPELEMRGLFDGTIAFAPDDVVRVKVAPAYLNMLVNRGRYLAAHGFTERAEALFREVLALDPSHGPARDSLAGAR